MRGAIVEAWLLASAASLVTIMYSSAHALKIHWVTGTVGRLRLLRFRLAATSVSAVNASSI